MPSYHLFIAFGGALLYLVVVVLRTHGRKSSK